MEIEYYGSKYNLNSDLDRKQLELYADMNDQTLQEWLQENVGISVINSHGKYYDPNNEKSYRQYSKAADAIERARIRKLKEEIDTRPSPVKASEEPIVEPELGLDRPLPENVSAEALAYYRLKDAATPEYEGRRSQLAEWAQNFGTLANKNYENRLNRGDELVRQVEQDFAQEQFAQFFKDDKMMALVEGKTPSASRTQVPDFDPSSMNQNIDVEDEEVIDPKLEAFGRMNTNPIESVSQ